MRSIRPKPWPFVGCPQSRHGKVSHVLFTTIVTTLSLGGLQTSVTVISDKFNKVVNSARLSGLLLCILSLVWVHILPALTLTNSAIPRKEPIHFNSEFVTASIGSCCFIRQA